MKKKFSFTAIKVTELTFLSGKCVPYKFPTDSDVTERGFTPPPARYGISVTLHFCCLLSIEGDPKDLITIKYPLFGQR